MKIGILLSGCGMGDGSQIEEVILTYLALDRLKVNYFSFAPNEEQYEVFNHFTEKSVINEKRNILIESARIGRGKIYDIKEISCEDIDGIILPGGMGIFKNLTTFAYKKSDYEVHIEVERLIKSLYLAKKPIGGMCGAILIIAKSLFNIQKELKLATGNSQFSAVLSKLNCTIENCTADDCYIDLINKVVTTPAFLASQNLHKLMLGIDKMVEETIKLC